MHGANALARLTELVPPPLSPAATDWDEAERVYRSPFPQGFRRMLETYGPGIFNRQLELFVVTPTDSPFSIARRTAENREVNRYRLAHDNPRPSFPYAEFPARRGLLTWGGLAEQGALHWLVDGPAESWVTVAQDYEFLVFVEIERPADEIVLALLEGGLPELRFADVAARPPLFAPLGDLLAR